MNRWIEKEIAAAKKAGFGWTKIRPLKYANEAVGAYLCSSSAHPGKRPAVAVSYSTDIAGRCVYCKSCAEGHGMAGLK